MGAKKIFEPRVYPFPLPVVANALLHGARTAGLTVQTVDPNNHVIRLARPMSMRNWGEDVTVSMRPDSAYQTSVVVESKLKVGLVAWGAHDRNFKQIHDILHGALATMPR